MFTRLSRFILADEQEDDFPGRVGSFFFFFIIIKTCGWIYKTVSFVSVILKLSLRLQFSQEDEEGRGDLPRLSEGEDSILEQTHHVIIPSYTSWFNNNRYVHTHNSYHFCS